MADVKNYFLQLNAINCNGKTEKKNGLTYLSWAYAWAEVKKLFPDANYTIYENAAGWNYHTDGKTAWVKTGVTVNGIEHIEYLPVMDHRNRSIPVDMVTSFDVNKTIQRSLTKAVARHGLGLYIYAGEDLPEEEGRRTIEDVKAAAESQPHIVCQSCGAYIFNFVDKSGKDVPLSEYAEKSTATAGKVLCKECLKKYIKEKKANA